ncbi:MAG: hypothetical protein P8Z79_10540 [Sedimentisphaerales bacterium]
MRYRTLLREWPIRTFAVRYSTFAILTCACCLVLAAGCQDTNKCEPLLAHIDRLTQSQSKLQDDLTRVKSEDEQLKQQVQVLSGLPKDVRLASLYQLQAVRIYRYTTLLDENKDGKMDHLVVYLQPIDEQGDVVKAAGAVNVQLWDLNKPSGQALLGQWNVGPEELKKRWVSFLVTDYRLTFKLPEEIAHWERPLTVKVTFTDYLRGKVFNEQRVIQPEQP